VLKESVDMRVRTVLALLLLTMYPAPAHAWWWDYFDGLSGPGPFKTPWPSAVEVRVWTESNSKINLLADSAELKWFVVARVVKVDNDWEVDHQHENFRNAKGEAVRVQLVTFDAAIMRRLIKAPALDLGGGLSLLRASGDTFDPQYRVGPIAKLTLAPLSRLATSGSFWSMMARVPKVYADFEVFRGFTGAEFGNAAVQLPKVEKKFRAGLLLDVTPLLCSAFDRTGASCK
jgi:hypothetical protein